MSVIVANTNSQSRDIDEVALPSAVGVVQSLAETIFDLAIPGASSKSEPSNRNVSTLPDSTVASSYVGPANLTVTDMVLKAVEIFGPDAGSWTSTRLEYQLKNPAAVVLTVAEYVNAWNRGDAVISRQDTRIVYPDGSMGVLNLSSKPYQAQALSVSYLINTIFKERGGIVSTTSNPSLSLQKFFEGGGDSLVAKSVGSAEGTRTPSGGYTRAYYGHVDPGNGVWNLGSYSYQHGAVSPQEADKSKRKGFSSRL